MSEATEYRQHRFEVPRGATEILLVRHGESRPARLADPFPLVDGHGDPELGEAGRRQAFLVSERLQQLPVDVVYATKLRRTVETITPLCEHLGIAPRINPDLHEVHLGDWEGGLFRKKAAEQDPVYVQMQAEERWDVIPGAEPEETFRTRVLRGIRTIAAEHPDKLVVAAVHGGVIGCVCAHATASRPFAFNGADNGSITQVVVQGEEIVLRRFNDAAHLHEDMFKAPAMPT